MYDEILTEKQVAPILGVSVSWLQRARWQGTGPIYIKYAHAVRYKLADILAWRETRMQQNTSQNSGKKRRRLK